MPVGKGCSQGLPPPGLPGCMVAAGFPMTVEAKNRRAMMDIIVLFILNKSMLDISLIYTLEDLSSTMQGSLDNRFVAFTLCIMASER